MPAPSDAGRDRSSSRAIRSAALLDPEQFLGGLLRAGDGVIERRPVLAQLVAAVLHAPDRAIVLVHGEGDDVTQPGREMMSIGLGLVELAGVEAPDPARGIEDRTRIAAGGARLPVVLLAGVRGRADVDVEHPSGATAMFLAECWLPETRPLTTVSGPPAGSIAPSGSAQRRIALLRPKYR